MESFEVIIKCTKQEKMQTMLFIKHFTTNCNKSIFNLLDMFYLPENMICEYSLN